VLGPEHELSIVDENLRALPIVDKIMKDLHGRIVNSVQLPHFTFAKELQMHVIEAKPNVPFESPIEFEETMQEAVLTLCDLLQRKHHAYLLGTGMHPLLKLDETCVWPHRHRQIYEAYSKVFSLKRHGWLNIQSFQLNLPYANEKEGVSLHNILTEVCAFLPAIAASSPVYEGKLGGCVDNRLKFYAKNQIEIPSVTGDVVPEYIRSFRQYEREVIGRYSNDLAAAGAGETIVGEEWVNSRGVIFRFDRRAVEIRVMDEQECIKSDVALSCFIRSLARGFIAEEAKSLPYEVLVKDYNAIVRDGLDAKVYHPHGQTARQVCQHFLRLAHKSATEEEKVYLPIIEKKMKLGNLSQIIRETAENRKKKTDLKEAIVDIYLELVKSLMDGKPYF
jgi:gamma-glutamyl:cysteine ligase YbdK (ATP-grasp superfamily)